MIFDAPDPKYKPGQIVFVLSNDLNSKDFYVTAITDAILNISLDDEMQYKYRWEYKINDRVATYQEYELFTSDELKELIDKKFKDFVTNKANE